MSLVLFQAEDGIRDLVRSRGLGDVYKRQQHCLQAGAGIRSFDTRISHQRQRSGQVVDALPAGCLLYTSDAADERSSVDLGGRRIIKKRSCDHPTATTSSM